MLVAYGVSSAVGAACYAGEAGERAFSFVEPVAPGHTAVARDASYSDAAGFGYEPGTAPDGEKPTLFSVRLPEGNYDVALTFADPAGGGSKNTVKAESRRLMLDRVITADGESKTRTFTVNVRNARIGPGRDVKLNQREGGVLHWDDKLTLEFNGERPRVRAVRIIPNPNAPTVFLAGDSTVTDQVNEPWAAWGQMLPRFFKSGVAVANHAESGESLKAFRSERRFEKIFSRMKAGDYLFIQFGHNDQKGAGRTEAFTVYKDNLARAVAEARGKGATPVLVTPMHRRRFGPDGRIVDTHGDYPQAVRQLAKEQNVPLIDLHTMSAKFYEAVGPDASVKAFVHYPAGTFPGQDKDLKDNTHFNAYGAYELAKCVIEGIRANKLPLAAMLSDDAPPSFDPAKPDSPDDWKLPPSPTRNGATITTPAGS
jgi:lysophospholipase L1-like esterase